MRERVNFFRKPEVLLMFAADIREESTDLHNFLTRKHVASLKAQALKKLENGVNDATFKETKVNVIAYPANVHLRYVIHKHPTNS